jgi:HNH endonuclease/AP2 domain
MSNPPVRELFDYDPTTGVMTYKAARKKCRPGAVAGYGRSDGYNVISVNRKNYLRSRLAWLWMTGHWPAHEIDHKDKNPSNDRWDNLREATRSQNEMNGGLRKNNRLGLKGVRQGKRDKGFGAGISINGKYVHLGTFPTAEEAHDAYKQAAAKYFGEFARHG